MPSLKESFKEILVKEEGNEEILIVTETETMISTSCTTAKETTTTPTEHTFTESTETILDQDGFDSEIAPLQTEETPENKNPIHSPSMQSNLNPEVEFEPESVPEVSVKPPQRSHHRRRRGARKSEKNKKQSAALQNNSVQVSSDQTETDLTNCMTTGVATVASENLEAVDETLAEKQTEWEMVPKEIIADPDSGKINFYAITI